MAKASDNQFPSVLFSETTTPTTPAAGTARLFIDTADGHAKRVDSAGSVTDLEAAGGGSSITRTSAIGDGSGAHTTTSTTFTDIVAGYSKTISAVTGDHLLCTFVCAVYNATSTGRAVRVGINIGGSVRIANEHIVITTQAYPIPMTVQIDYTVQAGDISAGLVTVKPQWHVSAGTGTMYNFSGVDGLRVPHLSVLNLGQ